MRLREKVRVLMEDEYLAAEVDELASLRRRLSVFESLAKQVADTAELLDRALNGDKDERE